MTEQGTRSDEPRAWREVSRRVGPDLFIFKVREETLEHPRTGELFRRVVLETPEWTNVVAITPERRLVLVRQYRFGVREVTLEIPGGAVDAGESAESAARRELLEETGYSAKRWSPLGCVQPNPAFHDNVCHHWLAEEAVRTRAPALDPGEDLSVDTFSTAEVARLVRVGEIRHPLVISALVRVIPIWNPRAEG